MAGEIRIPVITSYEDKGIKAAQQMLGSLGNKIKTVGSIAASYMVGAKAVSFVKDSAKAASDLQQSMTGVSTIFGSATPQIQDFINNGAKLGLTMTETAKATTFLGSVFKQTGMPMQDVIDHTKTMVALASDLAVTFGYSVDEALTAMTATFRGEYDPIEKFGVAMKQQQVNAELAARGLTGLKGAALIAAQQQIRYEMILQRTTDAQGAFGRSSGNLSVQMRLLNVVWENMQARLGSALVPALTKATVTMQPMIERLGPKLKDIFNSIADAVVQLIPMLPALAENVTTAFAGLGTILKTTGPALMTLISFISANIISIVTFFAAFKGAKVILEAVSAMKKFKTAVQEATVAQVAFDVALDANVIGVVALAIAGLTAAIVGLNSAMSGPTQYAGVPKTVAANAQKAADAAYKDAVKAGYYGQVAMEMADKARQKILDAYKDWQLFVKQLPTAEQINAHHGWTVTDAVLNGGGGAGSTATKVKTWFDNLADDVEKQGKRLKLSRLGLSKVLIDSLLNASDWQTAVAKVMGMTSGQIKNLIKQFSKTQAAQDAAAADLADRTSKFVDAVEKRISTVRDLTAGLGAFMPQTLAQVTADTGQFESAVLSAADTLRGSLASALDNKDITSAAYVNLMQYANTEISKMQQLAQARDKVVAKLEAAKSVYLEVAQAVRSYGNITSTTTSQVTESYKKIIDGVEVTVTRTVDALNSKDLVANYKAIVDKTKAFLANLTQLKKMGLNQTLFKQIIDAGVDAGNATAEAIVAGGGDTVASLNDLFGQLDTTGAQLGDLTARVMENSGITIVSGFIDGLTAQEADLAAKAKSLAELFSTTFNANVRIQVPTINPGAYGLTKDQGDKALIVSGTNADQNPTPTPVVTTPEIVVPIVDAVNDMTDVTSKLPSYMAKEIAAMMGVDLSALPSRKTVTAQEAALLSGANSLANAGSTYNVTVNAGLGTDGASVGQTVVQILKQYERNNGAIWVSA